MRRNRLSFTVTALIAAALALPSIAMAAPPPNDDFDAATPITSLAFIDTLGTQEATTAPDDPNCQGYATVWYSFTPSADIRVDANTFGSDYDTTISAYTGSRGSLAQLACNDDLIDEFGYGYTHSQIIFNATAGTTYYIMVATWAGRYSEPGNLNLTVQEAAPPPPPPVIALSVDRRGSVDSQGRATLSGSVSCDQRYAVRLGGGLTQKSRHRSTLQEDSSSFVVCQPPSVRWSMSFIATNRSFRPGPARFHAFAQTCINVSCALDQKAGNIHLRPSR